MRGEEVLRRIDVVRMNDQILRAAGSMLPLVLKRLGRDPAVSSAPFVATLVDVTGLIIYFSVAIVILRGRLL
jgi:Mg/Co/Ni transporter MgtE